MSIKLKLLTVVMTVGNFCFGQMENPAFVFDTAELKNRISNEYDYYKQDIIRCKTFYQWPYKRVHHEFIRMDSALYYCIEYDTAGTKIGFGPATKNPTPYDITQYLIYDSLGNSVDTMRIPLFRLYKSGYWVEEMDSFLMHSYGYYKDGLRDSVWIRVFDGDIQRIKYYEKGVLQKEEKVNLTGTGDVRIEKILQKKWAMKFSFTSRKIKFIPEAGKYTPFGYIQFNKDGTCNLLLRSEMKSNPLIGKWELFDNNTKIRFTFSKGIAIADILYISQYGLTLLFNEI